MIAEKKYGTHSAQVEMRIIVNGESLSVTHMGGDFVFLETTSEHPPGIATIVLNVDRSERRWQVKLPNGMSKTSKRVALAICE
jgi:hypothetical protein